jgi:hypothetical protein
MVRTQIQLTEEQADEIKRVANERRQSVAELIRQGVDMILKSGASVDSGERRRRAAEIAGKFSSGRNDISQKHDEYLADAMRK